MKRTWKPIIAGILDIILGIVMFVFIISESIEYQSLPTLVFLTFAIALLVGGVCALLRRLWWLALAGSILGMFPALVSIILIALSKDEFK